MPQLPFDTSCQAEYADGFILDETEHGDISAYVDCPPDENGVPTGPNILSDIVNRRPEPEHGPIVRFSVFYKDQRFDVFMDQLPANARPIRARDASMSQLPDGSTRFNGYHGLRIGYQYTDEDGKNHKEVREIF